MTVEEWLKLPPEEKLKTSTAYKRRYDEAQEFMGRTEWTPWEDLTHEQREAVRQDCIRYQHEMDDLGDAIRAGKTPP